MPGPPDSLQPQAPHGSPHLLVVRGRLPMNDIDKTWKANIEAQAASELAWKAYAKALDSSYAADVEWDAYVKVLKVEKKAWDAYVLAVHRLS